MDELNFTRELMIEIDKAFRCNLRIKEIEMTSFFIKQIRKYNNLYGEDRIDGTFAGFPVKVNNNITDFKVIVE